MVIGDTIAGILPELQAQAENLMRDVCTISRVTGTTEDGGFTIEVNVDVGTLAKAITVLDVTIKNGKPYLSLRNASDMSISQIRYRLMGYDATFQPVKMRKAAKI